MQEELQFARDVVKRASHLGRTIQREMTEDAIEKQDRTPVTVADFAIQAVISHVLQSAFPDDPLVGEEQAAPLQDPEQRSTLEQVVTFTQTVHENATAEDVCEWIERGSGDPSDRYWTLDPVDGTKGFLRGDQYAVALALIVDGEVQVGVLGCPNLTQCREEDPRGAGTIAYAQRGEGAYYEPVFEEGGAQQLSVSDTSEARKGVAVRSFESDHTDVELMENLMAYLEVEQDPVPMDSQAKYSVLASGAAEMYFRLLSTTHPGYREKIWDQAAGSIIVEEAGGRVTDLDGYDLDFSTGRRLTNNVGVLATNGQVHEKCLEALDREEDRERE